LEVEQNNGQSASSATVEAPRGFHSARVDDKGRLKLPSVIAEYVAALGDQRVFITTVDGATARIYPISVWRQNEILLEQEGEDTELKEEVAFIAYHYGADSDVDAQGRVLVPTELRRTLSMEGEQVFLRCFKQRIEVLGNSEYQARLEKAKGNLGSKLQSLEKKGFR
jgi:MraZ protein